MLETKKKVFFKKKKKKLETITRPNLKNEKIGLFWLENFPT